MVPHTFDNVSYCCGGYTMNGGMPIVGGPPAMQSIDQMHDMANSSDRPACMQTDIAAEVEHDFDVRQLGEEGTGGMLDVLDKEL